MIRCFAVTTQSARTRREKLQEFLTSHPADAFAQYGLALECAREGDHQAAIGAFQQLLAAHPDYVTGYFQYGQLLAKLGRTADARDILDAGIAAADRTGDAHASEEMAAARAQLA
jgi:tetratricopeptide (TPR) repeat protein